MVSSELAKVGHTVKVEQYQQAVASNRNRIGSILLEMKDIKRLSQSSPSPGLPGSPMLLLPSDSPRSPGSPRMRRAASSAALLNLSPSPKSLEARISELRPGRNDAEGGAPPNSQGGGDGRSTTTAGGASASGLNHVASAAPRQRPKVPPKRRMSVGMTSAMGNLAAVHRKSSIGGYSCTSSDDSDTTADDDDNDDDDDDDNKFAGGNGGSAGGKTRGGGGQHGTIVEGDEGEEEESSEGSDGSETFQDFTSVGAQLGRSERDGRKKSRRIKALKKQVAQLKKINGEHRAKIDDLRLTPPPLPPCDTPARFTTDIKELVAQTQRDIRAFEASSRGGERKTPGGVGTGTHHGTGEESLSKELHTTKVALLELRYAHEGLVAEHTEQAQRLRIAEREAQAHEQECGRLAEANEADNCELGEMRSELQSLLGALGESMGETAKWKSQASNKT